MVECDQGRAIRVRVPGRCRQRGHVVRAAARWPCCRRAIGRASPGCWGYGGGMGAGRAHDRRPPCAAAASLSRAPHRAHNANTMIPRLHTHYFPIRLPSAAIRTAGENLLYLVNAPAPAAARLRCSEPSSPGHRVAAALVHNHLDHACTETNKCACAEGAQHAPPPAEEQERGKQCHRQREWLEGSRLR